MQTLLAIERKVYDGGPFDSYGQTFLLQRHRFFKLVLNKEGTSKKVSESELVKAATLTVNVENKVVL